MSSYDGAIVTNTATIGVGGLVVNGPVTFNGPFTFQSTATTAVTGNTGTFYGDINGVGALYAGVAGSTQLPATVIQSAADVNDYIQNNFQNLNHGNQASTEWVATNDTGNDSNNYIDMGIAGHGWDGTQANSVGTAAGPSDSWIYAQGTVSTNEGGNLILGTIKNDKAVKILAGSTGSSSVVATFNGTGLTINTGVLRFADNTVQSTAAVSFNTGTLVAQAVSALSIPYANVTGTPNLSGYATQSSVSTLQITVNNLTNTVSTLTTTATVNALIANSLTNYTTTASVNTLIANSLTNVVKTIVAGTGTAVSVFGNTVTIWTTASGGIANLNNLSSDISFSTVGVGAPTFNTTSTGVKISYYPSESATMVDYATGIDAGVLWNSIPSATSNFAFKWYGGTSTVATLNGLGTLTATKFVGDGSSLTNVTVNIAGNIIGTGTNVSLVAGSYTYTFDNTGTFTMPVNGNIVMPGANTNLTVGGVALLGSYTQVAGYYSELGIKYVGGNTQYGMTLQPTADNTTAITFLNAAGTNIGSITQTTSTVKFVGDGSQLTGVATRTTGTWTVPTGVGTYSITVPINGAYQIWVRASIPNGIITYQATVHVSNTNVPVLGSQRAWNYAGGGSPILLTSIPNQIVGAEGTISTAVVATTTANRFDFGINNTSGSSQIVYWGYITL